MKRTGAQLVVYALEQLGVRHTFGIPGVHNTELYDALHESEQITPILVTHEGGAAFMADGVSRTSGSIGVLAIVPAAGVTHAMSGIGEAYLDGIPLLVISGGTRRDTGRHYQLHQLDQEKLVQGVVKQYFRPERHDQIIPMLYEAYQTATSGEPGPVFVEIPVDLQLFRGEVPSMPAYVPPAPGKTPFDQTQVEEAVDLLLAARQPGIYVGWGAVDAAAETARIAEVLIAPVSTTFQGISAFPADHPLHVGVGFGPSGLPAAQRAFAKCDALLAVGLRFSELATGSYGMPVPETLIHIDINPDVFHKNYPARLAIEGDAREVLAAIAKELETRQWTSPRSLPKLGEQIAADKAAYLSTWLKQELSERVSPARFFGELRRQLPADTYVVVDDGKHTFLTAELFPVWRPRHLISPTDFNCMGYCVPAAIGVQLSHPDQPVVAIVGDGAFQMTGLELITAATHGLPLVVFVFHDGELGQISQFQKIPLNRKTCTVLGDLQVEGIAIATGAAYLDLPNDGAVEAVLSKALSTARKGRPVIVDVRIDYSQKTLLTKGVVKTNLSRFPLREKLRFLARAAKRHLLSRDPVSENG